ncbi:MAG: YicC family protein [Bacteroidales bacterium]|nr:YicC family protein [Bacteroidales bacterium]
MMKSMTGYGKVTRSRNGKNIEVEIRSLNSKNLDVHTKVPQSFNDKDLEIRSMIAKSLERGKIDFALSYTNETSDETLRINETLLEAYFKKVTQIVDKLGAKVDDSLIISTLLRFSDVQKIETEDVTDDDWAFIRDMVAEAIKALDDFRIQEGQNLKNDFIHRIDLILGYLAQVEPLEKQRVPVIKERIMQRFEELKGVVDLDSNRLEQELIFYIEKLDITEEKVRLRQHCKYFIENIDTDESTGKKLGFIAQEMGREINTLGSKANDAEIQKIVVMMKDELEKIKEQVLNIL